MRQRNAVSGWLRQTARLAQPRNAVVARIALERDAALRAQRLRAAIADAVQERTSPTRRRMRALVASPGGGFRLRLVPAPPAPGPLGAVVHPIAMATCDMDRPLALGATPFPLPLHFGHECVAEVLSVGEAVTGVRPGQRVVVPFQISCGVCAPCTSGRPGNCAGVPPASMYGFGLGGGHWGGAMSDELAVPYADAMLVPLPDGADAVACASVADNVSDGYRHIGPYLPALLAADSDAEVLIVAALERRPVFTASVPLYAGIVARALGARNVVLVDSRGFVRAHAERLGLNALPPRALRGRSRRAPLVVEVAVSRDGLALALSHTAPDGVCSSAGSLRASLRIPALLMYGRNVTLHVSRTHARTVIPLVLDLVTSARLQPETVTTTVAPLDDAPAVLREHLAGESTKVVLTA